MRIFDLLTRSIGRLGPVTARLAVVTALGVSGLAACESSPVADAPVAAALQAGPIEPQEPAPLPDSPPGTPVAPAPPNVLLVIADDVAWYDVGAYQAGTGARTPTLDALAARGVRFDSAWTNPLCSPTRGSIYTGRHAFRHGVGLPIVDADDATLSPSETTIAELLRDHGYATALVGKWHLGRKSEQGGDCAPTTTGGFATYHGNLEGAVEDYYAWSRTDAAPGQSGCPTALEGEYATVRTTDDAATFIAAQRAAGQPWFTTVAFNAAHTPFHAPPAGLYTGDVGDARCAVADARECYLAILEAADTKLGDLFTGLGGLDAALADTLIVFVGDNGTPGQAVPSGVSPARAKGTVYQAGVTVPLIMAGPGVPSGQVRSGLVQSLDIFRTIADAARIELSSAVPSGTTVDSVSLMDVATGASSGRSTVYTEVFGDGTEQAAIRDGRYKLLRLTGSGGVVEQLYDLSTDPSETRDLLRGRLTVAQRAAYNRLTAAFTALRSS